MPEGFNADKSVITFFTSGSTGKPKEIEKTVSQLECEIKELQKMWPCRYASFYSTVSHQHIYGLLFSLLWPVCAGRPLCPRTISHWEEFLGLGITDEDVLSYIINYF